MSPILVDACITTTTETTTIQAATNATTRQACTRQNRSARTSLHSSPADFCNGIRVSVRHTFYEMKIIIKQVLAQAEERKKEVKPLPKIVIGGKLATTQSPVAKQIPKETAQEAKPKVKDSGARIVYHADEKDIALKNLYGQISEIKTERGKLSTKTAHLVNFIEENLRAESPSKANAFMSGELPIAALKEHRQKIEALTDQGAALYDKIKYVEQYGRLPEDDKPALPKDHPQADALTTEIRRLDKLIYKTKTKINGPQPKNPSRGAMWKQKLEIAEAARELKKRQLKIIQDGARAERAGE
jgi:hypothetical protein